MIRIGFGANGFDVSSGEEPKRQRKKGESRLVLPQDYTVIDLETTGLDPRYDDIIEIACIKYRGGEEIGRFQSLVQPPLQNDDEEDEGEPFYVDEFIESLTGITNEMLADAPKFEAIEQQVANLLDGELLVGHNVNFDINFLYDNLEPYGVVLGNDFVDTMRLSRRALPELAHHRLSDLSDYFSIEGKHHRAMGDCEMTHEVLCGLKKIIEENHVDLSPHRFPQLDLRTLQPDPTKFVQDHILYGRNCVFTGKLERFSRKEAAQIVLNIGGHCENNVTKNTNFLVVGNFDYCSNVKGNKTGKLKKAEGLILKGQDLQILSESAFYDLVEGLDSK